MNRKLGLLHVRATWGLIRTAGTDATQAVQLNSRRYPQVKQEFSDDGYPILKIFPRARNVFEFRKRPKRVRVMGTPLKNREEKMPEDIDWPSAWSTTKTYVPSAVPLPLKQSYQEKGVPRDKYLNTELIKINNFLHLTPVAIERHCQALRKFCTTWPEGLESDDDVKAHFPVTKITRDYIHSSPNIRDDRARVVDLVINIKDLKLSRDDEIKLIKLAAHRYDEKTGDIKIKASSCPYKLQNKDYADYLLTALYFESIKHESNKLQ